MAISPDGRNVYVGSDEPDPGNSVLMTFTRSSGGSLHTPPTSTSLPGGYTSDIAVSSDGRSVYVVSDGTLRAFLRETGTGKLSALQCLSGEARTRCLRPRAFPEASAVAVGQDRRDRSVQSKHQSLILPPSRR